MAPLPPVRKRKDYSDVSPKDLTFALFHDRIAPHDAMRASTEDAIDLGLRQKGFTIYKDDSGRDRWLAITTTAYEDKDREIISRNAIKEAVALGDKTKERGPLLFWHVPGLVMGACDFQAQGGPGDRFLIEGGTFRNKAMASLGQKLSDAGYQMSPGFIHTDDQPSNGVYDHILIYERSAVPQNRAANYFTRYATAKEDKVLAPEKIAEYREKAAGNAEALAMLDSLLATAQKDDDTAQARNVVYKEAPAWAQALITRVDDLGATVKEMRTAAGINWEGAQKAFPPAAVEGSPEEEAAEPEEEAMAEGDMEADQADDGMGDGMDDAAFAQLIAKAVVEALTPLLDIEKKMAGHMGELKTALSGFSAQKDDAAQAQATAQAQEVATLKAKVDELTGDLPTSVMNGARNYYRASESIATQLTPQAAATIKESLNNVPAGLTDPAEIAAYKLIFREG
jgi:hypothetical protein